MKTLSIRQPWAWLIANGIKTVENRTWKTNYRGQFLIHASTKFAMSQDEFAELRQEIHFKYHVEIPTDLPAGGIVGIAEIVDCVPECDTRKDKVWHEPGCYAFIIRNAQPLEFEPMPGKLNFFEVDHISSR